jgi:hypothetical protein
MLMKLALYDDDKVVKDIIECCRNNNAHYISLYNNRFGILTEKEELGFGREDSFPTTNLNIKNFIDIYKCVTKIQKNKKTIFGNKNLKPYSGLILNNSFFRKVFQYCNGNKDFEIESIIIQTKHNDDIQFEEVDEIENIFETDKDMLVKLLSVYLKDENIIFNKEGYVYFQTDHDFFEKNKEIIVEILNYGLKS